MVTCACGGWVYQEQDAFGWTDAVCINGHRITVTPMEPLPLVDGMIGQRPKGPTLPTTIHQKRREMKWDQ